MYELGKRFLGPFEIAIQITSQDRLFSVTSCTPRSKMFWFNILLFGYQVYFLYTYNPETNYRSIKRPGKIFPCIFAMLASDGDVVYFCQGKFVHQWQNHSGISTETSMFTRTDEFLVIHIYTADIRGMHGLLLSVELALCLRHVVSFPNDFPLIADRRWF